MLIWAVVVVGPPESEDELLKYLLRLIQKGAQVEVVLMVFKGGMHQLCCGRPSLGTVQSLKQVLSNNEKWKFQTRQWYSGTIFASISSCARSADSCDVHLSVVGSKLGIRDVCDSESLRWHLPKINNVYVGTSLDYLFLTTTLFKCPLVLGDITIQVTGFSTLKEAQAPAQTPCFNGEMVKEKPSICYGSRKQVFNYGQTLLDVTPQLMSTLKTPVSSVSRLEVCGFMDRPPPQQRGPSPTLLRAVAESSVAFDALVQSLASQKQAAVVRFQKAGGHAYMATLNPIGYSNPEKLYLLMEPLPFSQDWPTPPMQFPVLEPRPVDSKLDQLIDSLPELDGVSNLTNTPNTCVISGPSNTKLSKSHRLLIKNPLVDRIYDEVLKQVMEITPTVQRSSFN